jgi:hypothetical protein
MKDRSDVGVRSSVPDIDLALRVRRPSEGRGVGEFRRANGDRSGTFLLLADAPYDVAHGFFEADEPLWCTSLVRLPSGRILRART